MSLQMVDINERDIKRASKTLGKAYTNKQRTHQTRSTCESHGTEVFLLYTCTRYGLINNRHHVLLMCTRSQLGHYATIGFVHLL